MSTSALPQGVFVHGPAMSSWNFVWAAPEGGKESFAPEQVIAPKCDSDAMTSLLLSHRWLRGREDAWFLLCPGFDSALPVTPETVKV